MMQNSRLIFNLFDRGELQLLRERAVGCLDQIENPQWKAAYHEFLMACDRLDAMNARSIQSQEAHG